MLCPYSFNISPFQLPLSFESECQCLPTEISCRSGVGFRIFLECSISSTAQKVPFKISFPFIKHQSGIPIWGGKCFKDSIPGSHLFQGNEIEFHAQCYEIHFRATCLSSKWFHILVFMGLEPVILGTKVIIYFTVLYSDASRVFFSFFFVSSLLGEMLLFHG